MAAEPLTIRTGLEIPGNEIAERFGPSGGPGGQHANRAHTRVELRFDIEGSPSLSDHQRERLLDRFGAEVRVVVDEERSQSRNRAIARERLAARIRHALIPTRTRTPTRPSAGSRKRRIEAKKRRGDLKRTRQRPSSDG